MASTRLHYLDNLRALAMLSGVFFHAALAHSTLLHQLWLTADPSHTPAVDAIVWFLHLFRMPVFFAIAGYFAAGLVAHHGLGGMLQNRLRRILIPLVLVWPLVSLSTSLLIRHTHPEFPVPLLLPSLVHLWFLAYLMLFYLVIWIAITAQWPPALLGLLFATPLRRHVLVPLLLTPAVASVTAPTPAPEGLLPQLWAVVFYGCFFCLGYARLPQGPPQHWQLFASVSAYALFFWLIHTYPNNAFAHPCAALLESCISVWMTTWCLTAAARWLNTTRPLLRFLADASYWTYLLHLPLVFLFQLALQPLPLPWPLKLTLTFTLTLAICLITYRCLPVAKAILGAFKQHHERTGLA